MKNFSTVGLLVSFAAGIGALGPAHAQSDRLASEQVSAERIAAVSAACNFRADAPDRHVVVRGDTLWHIAGRFLEHPWCWPEVWDLNREQIANPHWIYPGQVVWFDRAAGKLRLGTPVGNGAGASGVNGTLRLQPQIRTEDLGREAVPAIDASAIEAFVSQPLIVENDELAQSARIIAIQEGHVYLGRGDTAYVRGNLGGATLFQVFRPGQPLRDPVSNKVIAHEAFYLGTVKIDKPAAPGSDVHTIVVTSSKQEMGVGDRLLPMPQQPILNYVPHRPLKPIKARVVSIYGGVSHAGQGQIVTVSAGSKQGLDVGSVLVLNRTGREMVDKSGDKGWFGRGERVKLPDEQYGTLFIFRVFKDISYGLIMQGTDAVKVGDGAKSPD